MADLITQGYAVEYIGGPLGSANPTLNADELTLISAAISACSAAAIYYCQRDWTSTAYDEIISIDQQRFGPMLSAYPIISIASLRSGYAPVLTIQQLDNVTNQYATVTILSTGLSLSAIASGVNTVTTAGLTFAGNPTLAALTAAVNGLGTNWQALVNNPYGLFPSTDLYIASIIPAPINALRQLATLYTHTIDHQNFAVDPSTGRLQPGNVYAPFAIPRELFFTRIPTTMRCKYTAGYASIPLDVQGAIAEWVVSIFWLAKRDPALLNASQAGLANPPTTITNSYTQLLAQMPPMTQQILNTYRQRSVARNDIFDPSPARSYGI
jgi:hypothetical protein